MPKILFLPLDERPCNYAFPAQMCEGGDAELCLPPRETLGCKKSPADTAALDEWMAANIRGCQAAVLSVDMLLYGGIVPSRLHRLTGAECLRRIDRLRALRRDAPDCKIYAFNLIMRAPAYSSSEEEPDYYATYGRMLYEIGYATDKAERDTLSDEEKQKLEYARQALPPEVLADFTARRQVNRQANEAMVDLVKEGIVDFLVIPLDDCAQYGWAAREQRELRKKVIRLGLSNRVYMYSGADEVGGVLLARAVNTLHGINPAVFLRYSAVKGALVIPKYEDRPLGENLKWQIATAGGHVCAGIDEADFALMVNAPTASGEAMGEASQDSASLDASYFSERCLPEFVNEISHIGKPVALADVALANGADNELMGMLREKHLLGKLSSYAAWNTAANSAGTCIAHMMLRQGRVHAGDTFTKLRLLEDWAYMANVRELAMAWVVLRGGGFYDISGFEEPLGQFIAEHLQRYADEWTPAIRVKNITFPWRRLFDIAIELDGQEEANQ